MVVKKLLLHDDLDIEPYAILGISASIENYRLAYNINKHLGIKLKRLVLDIEGKNETKFPIFEYKDEAVFQTWHLVSNRYKESFFTSDNANELFGGEAKYKTTYLLPEHKTAAYLLKLTAENCDQLIKEKLESVRNAWGVTAAFIIQPETIKSNHNLIF